jgi:hypothetical protein
VDELSKILAVTKAQAAAGTERIAFDPMALAHAIETGIAARVAAERERLCAAIKAEDDYCVTEGDYMLDSDDCIRVIRGTWVRPEYNLGPNVEVTCPPRAGGEAT